jgi:hypothetical protein
MSGTNEESARPAHRGFGEPYSRRECPRSRKRYDEFRRCEAVIRETLAGAHVKHTLVFRQLYHDREEVTGYLARIG